jgi:membrane protein required for colicin V production
MAPVDIFLLLVVLASVLLGIWRGLVYEVLSVAGWVAAFFVAQWYAEPVSLRLPLGETAEPLRYAAGFVVVFVATVFASGLLAWLLKQLIEKVGLRPVDRVLGAGFGLLRGGVILLAVALVVGMTPLKSHAAWQASVGARWLDASLHALKGVMPENLAKYFP